MRQLFSSRLATVLTMIGVAVGLGNVWRFPYMMGSYGGSAFLLVYLAIVALFALPALTAEWALGRATRRGPIGALSAAFGSRTGKGLGALLLISLLIANSYYLVVIANVFYSAGFALFQGFSEANLSAYQAGLENGILQATVGSTIIICACVVLGFGLRRGIERVSILFVPVFGIVVLYLIVNSLLLPGAVGKLRDFLNPDFQSLTRTSIFAAMGQAFFSLSLGGTFFVAYGSFLREEEKILPSGAWTALGDVGAALLAALFIVPATLVLGLDLQAGPQLIFVTLPSLFQQIPAGHLSAPLFFLAVGMVAFLSSMAALQVILGGLVNNFAWSRGKALVVLGTMEALLMIPTAFHPEFIATLDLIFGSGMQVLGSGIALVALTFGLGRLILLRQLFTRTEGTWPSLYFLWLRWVVPVALAAVLVLYIMDNL